MMNRWRLKMWFIYKRALFGLETNGVIKSAGKLMNLEAVILSVLAQAHKDKHCVFLMYGSYLLSFRCLNLTLNLHRE